MIPLFTELLWFLFCSRTRVPEKVNHVPACLIGVKAGRVYLCRVALNTV